MGVFKGTSRKIVSRRRAVEIAAGLRRAKKKVVVTNGAFDILHAGHVDYLERSRRLGDVLFVALNSDASIRGNKGKNRPIISQRERARLLAALACVDYVIIFNGTYPDDLLVDLHPHYYTKGGSFIKGRLAQTKRMLASSGCRTRVFPLKGGVSSSVVIERCHRLKDKA